MPEYPFPPPDRYLQAVTVAVPLLVGFVLVGPLASLLFRRCRAFWGNEFRWWLLCSGACGVAWSGFPYCYDRLSGFHYLVLTLVVSSGIVLLKSCRPSVLRKHGPIFTVVYGALVFLGVTLALFPAVSTPREAHRRLLCKNNLRQLGLAAHNFHDRHTHFPSAVTQAGDEPPRSWRVELLPYLDEQRLRDAYDDASTWDSVENAPLLKRRPGVYGCPSIPGDDYRQPSQLSAYAMVTGPHTFGSTEHPTPERIRDGLSHTAMFVEACGRRIPWLEPRDVELRAEDVGINLPGDRPEESRAIFSSYHTCDDHRSAHVCLADGRVVTVSDRTDPVILRAILTVDGGEEFDVDGSYW